jgi:opacity protein-like surface antigen
MPLRALCFGAVCAAVSLASAAASAAPPWVDRHLTVPSADWAFDFGLGVGHVGHDPTTDRSAVGINAEAAVGVTDRVEIGVRTGIRLGDGDARSIRADEYGRLFDRQTFGTGTDLWANPEARVRGAPIRGRVVELALEGRIGLPVEGGTNAGLLLGVPLSFHFGHRVRLDTGAYLPIVFLHPAYFALRLPLDVWIEVARRVWLGPMTGVVVERPFDIGSRGQVSLGFGLGYQITHYLDFKAMVLLPTLNSDGHVFGVGAGVEIRIE